jgi:hypothetical protein
MHMVAGPNGCMIIPPQGNPGEYKTYEIQQELDEVSCEAAFCPDFMLGFVTTCDLSTDLGRRQAEFIRKDKGRSHIEEMAAPGLVQFTFPPGTRCFAPPDRPRHLKPRDGEQRLIERGGDWRGNPSGVWIEHTRAEFFLESWAENQDGLIREIQRG